MSYKKLTSDSEKNIYIADSAEVIADVRLAEGVSIWYNSVVRGDVAPVTIGRNTNIQDLSMVHTSPGKEAVIGENVTVGHGAILHGCSIEDNCMIGMGAIILDGAKIGEGSIIGAGTLITQGKNIPPRSVVYGSPAKIVREVTDAECAEIIGRAEGYAALAEGHFAD